MGEPERERERERENKIKKKKEEKDEKKRDFSLPNLTLLTCLITPNTPPFFPKLLKKKQSKIFKKY